VDSILLQPLGRILIAEEGGELVGSAVPEIPLLAGLRFVTRAVMAAETIGADPIIIRAWAAGILSGFSGMVGSHRNLP
jgi:hypothetical protein